MYKASTFPDWVTVYPDRSGIRWWTKAWFNNREEGESSVEITRQLAILFLQNQIEKDQWLEEIFSQTNGSLSSCHEQTREQLLNQINV